MSYPEKCLRGISKADMIDENGYLKTACFSADKNPGRDHDDWEISINWFDDSGAIKELLTRVNKRTEKRQFSGGIAVLDRKELDHQKKGYYGKNIDYERHEQDDNKYHGNILISGSITDNGMKKMLYGVIAQAVKEILPIESDEV